MHVINKKTRLAWTPERVNTLMRCVKQKMQWDDICAVTGRDKTSIQNKLSILGVSYVPPYKPRPAGFFEPAPPIPKTKDDPIQTAYAWIGCKRLKEANGLFWLDGIPTSLLDIMRETNRLLKGAGAEQIVYNPEWRVT